VYLAESLGAGAGGLVFYFILLPLYPSFAGSLLLIVFLLGGAMVCGAGLNIPESFSARSLLQQSSLRHVFLLAIRTGWTC